MRLIHARAHFNGKGAMNQTQLLLDKDMKLQI